MAGPTVEPWLLVAGYTLAAAATVAAAFIMYRGRVRRCLEERKQRGWGGGGGRH